MEPDKKDKMAAMIAEELATGPLEWWWLSFADVAPPEGRGFLGAVLAILNSSLRPNPTAEAS